MQGKFSLYFWITTLELTIAMLLLGGFAELMGWLYVVQFLGNESWVMQGYFAPILVLVSLPWSVVKYIRVSRAIKSEQSKEIS